MPSQNEAKAIAAIFTAANKLSNDYAVPGGAANRREQLSAFVKDTINAIAALTAEHDEADPAYVAREADSVVQAIEVAFMDAIEAEEASETRIDPVRDFGTYDARNL
jgi:hypothetical protein